VSDSDDLHQLGFKLITEWISKKDKIGLSNLRWEDHSEWLYSFVVDRDVKYIGMTERVLRSRMDDYRDLKNTQTTRLREHITAELAAARTVQIFGRKERDPKAEEAILRAKYRPVWNHA
jgi:hypothetical protein